MNKIWLISDTHFNHQMLVDNKFRPFLTIKEMNDRIIKNWNKLISKDDLVYHLGDVVLGDKDSYKQIESKLNGNIIYIRGNHDPQCISNIESCIITFKNKTFELIHNPNNSNFNTDYVIHGHIHKGGKRELNVCEEQLYRFYNVNLEFHKYKPKLLNDILGELTNE